MLTCCQCFFEASKGDLLSDDEDTGLFDRKFEYLDDEVRLDIFEFLEILRKFDMWEFEEFDGDR